MNKFLPTAIIACVAVLVAACAARPELPARSAANPVGIDLTGRWALQVKGGEHHPRAVESEQRIYVPRESAAGHRQHRSGRAGSSKRSKSPSVYVFIENGRSLKITQTEHGLFVSFDRAVVEEYTFGENRTVSLGPIEAQRVSGWNGSVFIVETMDERGATLTETWALASDGSELVREVGVADGEKQLYASRQVFDRL